MAREFAAILEDIKIQHTVFAMPFAVMSAFIAAHGTPPLGVLGLIVVAMVFARSAAMAFNRLVDATYDGKNPRTKGRVIPSGMASRGQYVIFIVAASAGFILACSQINRLSLILSPVALLIVFFYSYTKRFTAYSHFFLGLALSLAPLGAWVAVKEEISAASLVLAGAVVFWLAGLDAIYSLQDVEFDRAHGLNSIPQRFGVQRALILSAVFHAVMVGFLFILPFISPLSWIYAVGASLTAGLLLYEHWLVRPDDLSKVNVAFFNVNGVISVGLMAFTIADILV
jgi:4-hydroxybenzoate polyprenyltransferase